MEEIRIEIPKHIRQVQLSQKQRPIYFEWNGISIHCRKKKIKIPRKLFKNSKTVEEGQDILIEDLKEGFCIAIINKSNRIIDKIRVNNLLPPLKDLVYGYKYILHIEQENRCFPVYANPMKVNKPKIYLINGQDVYNGYLTGVMLGFVMGKIKEDFKPYIQNLPVINEYPIDIKCEVHDTIKNPYSKTSSEIGGQWDLDNYTYPYLKAFPDLLVAEGKIKNDDRLHIPGNIPAIFVPVDNHDDRKLIFIISKTTRKEVIENKVYREYHSKNPETYETEDLDLIKDSNILNVEMITPYSQEEKEKLFNMKIENLSIEEISKRYSLTPEEIEKLKKIQNENI